jgi:hypothetical protein
MRRAALAALAITCCLSPARAAQHQAAAVALADNSFLIEEAYNQERGVVQHVLLFARERRATNWALGFTQEWPAWSERHQVSYTVPLIHRADGATSFGDLAVHYRYQLAGGPVAIAPRVSVLLPTGSGTHGTTTGGFGVQAALPASLRLSGLVTVHVNAGASLVPSARAPGATTGSLLGGFVGGSLIGFVHPRINLVAEGLVVTESLDEGRRTWISGTLGSLGVRWGHDLPGGVQVVPGVAWGFGTGLEREAGGLLAYLSVEHRFR